MPAIEGGQINGENDLPQVVVPSFKLEWGSIGAIGYLILRFDQRGPDHISSVGAAAGEEAGGKMSKRIALGSIRVRRLTRLSKNLNFSGYAPGKYLFYV